MTFEEIAADYKKGHAAAAQAELDRYASMDSLADVIREAGAWESISHTHRRGVTKSGAARAVEVLLENMSRLNSPHSFEELLTIIEEVLSRVDGTGKLYSYDVALRIGSKLALLPEEVYLHAGAGVGAKALGFSGDARSIPVSEFPPPLQVLDAYELEDVLCRYKGNLGLANTEYRNRR